MASHAPLPMTSPHVDMLASILGSEDDSESDADNPPPMSLISPALQMLLSALGSDESDDDVCSISPIHVCRSLEL